MKWLVISIHASREGSDQGASSTRPDIPDFNPRFPRGKRLTFLIFLEFVTSISIHASREGSDMVCFPILPKPFRISIHASREGSDFALVQIVSYLVKKISIHASREGSDNAADFGFTEEDLFQSTLPAREATFLRIPC